MNSLNYFLALAIVSALCLSLNAQNDALFSVESNSQGILIPSMSETQRNAIVNPTEGLLIYQNTSPAGFYYYEGSQWTRLADGNVNLASNKIMDNDGDTQIQTEESPDEDRIRFDLGGVEQWIMDSHRLEPLNSGKSLFIGKDAGLNDDLSSNFNMFLGDESGMLNTDGFFNIGIGYQSLKSNVNASINTAIGYRSMTNNVSGNNNTTLGAFSLMDNDSGFDNVSIGAYSLFNNTGGFGNIAVGKNALISNEIGNYNTAIGHNADTNSDDLYNATAIGYNAKVNNSNSLVLGGSGVDAVNVGVGTAAPDEELHVVGNIKMVDGNQANSKVLTSDNNGVGTWQDLPTNLDNDPTNELQNLNSVLLNGNSAGNQKIINLMDPMAAQDAATKNYVDLLDTAEAAARMAGDDNLQMQINADMDGDATNEYNTSLSLAGTTLQVTDGGGTKSTDLAALQDGTGTDDQTLSEVLTEGNSAGNMNIIDMADPVNAQDAVTKNYVDANDDDTDNQVLSLNMNTLELTSDDGTDMVDLSTYLDNTDAQTLSLSGTSLTIEDGNSVDLSVIQDGIGTDDQILSLNSNTLELTSDNGNDMVDLSPYLDNTDEQTLLEVLTEGNSAGNMNIIDIADPVNAQDAATKAYVDANIGDSGTIQGTDTNTYNIRAHDEGTVAGNGRGENSVDLQTERSVAAEVASASYSVIVGGANNEASGDTSAILGGSKNRALGERAFIGAGAFNTVSLSDAAVVGGFENTASGTKSFVGGGEENTASSNLSTVVGGIQNNASGPGSFIGGGASNIASGDKSSIGGGEENLASAQYASVGGGNFNLATDANSRVGGGFQNTASGIYSVIAGGFNNITFGIEATISGGYNNSASGNESAILGGYSNVASGDTSTVAGGSGNMATAERAFIGGGFRNVASFKDATVAGGEENTASGSNSFVGGGEENTASGVNSVVSGGDTNLASGERSIVSGGGDNVSSGLDAVISGGFDNLATGNGTVISGGVSNEVSALLSSIGGGIDNLALGESSRIGGGQLNTSVGDYSAIPGGQGLTAVSLGETVVGLHNIPSGGDQNNFVGTDPIFIVGNGSDDMNQSNALVIEKEGDVGIGTDDPDEKLHVVGNIKMVDGNEALDKVLTSDADGIGSWQALPDVGDVDGPASSIDNAVARFDMTTGKLIQDSGVIIDDTDNLSGIVNITLSGTVDGIDVSDHSAANSGVHGVTGTIVGTSDSQTLTNKTIDAASNTITGLDHGANLTGLLDDDHTQYALLGGRSGGQTLTGGTAAGEDLTLQSTSDASKGSVVSLDPMKIDDIDTNTATTLIIGQGTATKIELADTGVDTEIQGNLDVLEGLDVTGNITLTGTVDGIDISAHAAASAGVHGITGSVVGTSDPQILTNKALLSPIISTISNTGTLTLPSSTDVLVGRATTDILTNKTIDADNNTISNIDNAAIKAAAGIDASKIANGSVSNTEFQQLASLGSAVVGINDTQTLTNKSFTDNQTYLIDNGDNSKIIQFELSGITTATTRTLTIPDANTTLVGTDATQVLTNKSIDADNNTITNIDNADIKAAAAIDATKIANGTVSNTEFQQLASVGSAVVGINDTQTLSNKTLTTPIVQTGINDLNGNEFINLTATGSAVNEITLTNASTTNNPVISASGDDTDIGLDINAKGLGTVSISGISYPNSDGSSGQFLTTDGSGNASWANAAGTTISTITTADATASTIQTISTVSDGVYFIEASLVARRTDSGTEGGGFKLTGVFRNDSGTLTKIGDNLTSITDETWVVDIMVSGTDIIIRVTGESGKTINWKTVTEVTMTN